MIKLKVVSVTRKSSSEISTCRWKDDGGERRATRTAGAEWEEVEFTTEFEENPNIQIANVAGDYVMLNPAKLILNEPSLFGTYKSGDIIEFMPKKPVDPEAN